MTNTIALWLELLGRPERAARLLRPWQGDPCVALIGQRNTDIAYAQGHYRPALDSWDCGLTTRRDLVIWAKHVAEGAYTGPYLVQFIRIQPNPWTPIVVPY